VTVASLEYPEVGAAGAATGPAAGPALPRPNGRAWRFADMEWTAGVMTSSALNGCPAGCTT